MELLLEIIRLNERPGSPTCTVAVYRLLVRAGLRWMSDDVSFIKREAFQKVVDGPSGRNFYILNWKGAHSGCPSYLYANRRLSRN